MRMTAREAVYEQKERGSNICGWLITCEIVRGL
jgi:hypothetical protein